MKKRLTSLASVYSILLGALCCIAPATHAQQLKDPTQPPNLLMQDADVTATSGPVLQSVLLSPARKVAIISGQTVKVGDQFGSAKVIKITEGEVVLRNGNELQTLRLFPSIGKQPASDRKDRHPVNRK